MKNQTANTFTNMPQQKMIPTMATSPSLSSSASIINGEKMMMDSKLSNNGMMMNLPPSSSMFDSTSLLGMAAISMMNENSMFGNINPGQLQQRQRQAAADPLEITSQVLAELGIDEGNVFDNMAPPTDDIFDIEPVPISAQSSGRNSNNNIMNNNPSSQPKLANRFALLEDTLNQVLSDEADFFATMSPQKTNNFAPATSSVPVSPCFPLPENLKRSRMMTAATLPSSPQQQEPAFKKQRTAATTATTVSPLMGDTVVDEERFRDYQSKQWSEKFQELIEFKAERGHCCVPHTFKENPSLARWVKRQRYQYKLKNEDKPSTMTDERIAALEKMGFVWDSHGAAWMERWSELSDYRKNMGHCNVPSNFAGSPQLATWVKCQRRQFKLFWAGKPSNMSLDRISKLENLGFEWELRGTKKGKQMTNIDDVVPVGSMNEYRPFL